MSVILTPINHPGRLARLPSAVRDSGKSKLRLQPSFPAASLHGRHHRLRDLLAERIHHIFDVSRRGFEVLIIADIDDGPSAFARAIEKASARAVAGMVRSGIRL